MKEPRPAAGASFKIYRKQAAQYWCWAACAEMVLHALNIGVKRSQCQIVSRFLGRTDCCDEPTPAACDRPYDIDEVRALYQDLGVSCAVSDVPLPEKVMMSEICQDSPVQLFYVYPGQAVGHMVLLIGSQVVRGQTYAQFCDPLEKGGKKLVLLQADDLTAYNEHGRLARVWFRMRPLAEVGEVAS